MTADRWAVIGLARPRSPWFRDLTAWANAGLVPVDFLKCIGAAEVRARLGTGTPCSALLADADAPGLDRDLIAAVHAAGAAVLVVSARAGTAGVAGTGARGLDVDAVLAPELEPHHLLDALRNHAPPLHRTATGSGALLDVPPGRAGDGDGERGAGQDDEHLGTEPGGWAGRLIPVLGANGAGTSTIAMALAQGLATRRPGGAVALADLAIGGHLAMYHDAGDVVPGLQELTEAHRRATPTRAAVRAHLAHVEARGYDLLSGLRRPRDWTAVRTRALEASIRSLLAAYRQVVVDVDADLDGEAETGSADLEDRNARGRLAVARADVAVVVVDASLKGLHDGTRVLRDVAPRLDRIDRLLPVVTRAPRGRRARAELAAALAQLGGDALGVASPVFVEHARDLESAHRIGGPLPRGLVDGPAAAVTALLDRLPEAVPPLAAAIPVAVRR